MKRGLPDYTGKCVYITGGSSGIGKAAASLFLRQGADIILFARNRERLENAVMELKSAAPKGSVHFYPLDVSDPLQVNMVMKQALAEKGAPDVLITSAGTSIPGYFEKISLEDYRQMVQVNLDGTWNTLQALVPHMKRGGHIVTVASVAGFVGTFGYTAYGATKFAIIGLSEALRCELRGRGINVSVLCPPDTDTPQLKQEELTKPDETKAISGNVRVMSPEKVAAVMLEKMTKGKFLIIPGTGSLLVHFATRFCPALVRFMMDRDVRRVQEQTKQEKEKE
jgi:3-dehydrosphinganine reductase